MKHPYLILLFLSLSASFFGQVKKEQMTIYYESNVHKLTKQQKVSVVDFLDQRNLLNVELYGFADTVGNVQANQKISEQRVQGVKDLILSWYENLLIVTKANGENLVQDTEFDNQRRVEIVITYELDPPNDQVGKFNIPSPSADSIPDDPGPDLSQQDVFNETFTSSDRIVIENLLFEPGKTEFLHGKTPNELYYLVDLMDSIQSLKIHIEGHVCCVDNQKLSKERAKTVYLFLRAFGIDKHRMTFAGYSNNQPRVEELTKEDQKFNRRVEIVITER